MHDMSVEAHAPREHKHPGHEDEVPRNRRVSFCNPPRETVAMEDTGGDLGNLSGEVEDSITDPTSKDIMTKTDTTKPEDLDGLQMLRLAQQEEDKSLFLRIETLPISSDQAILEEEDPVDDEVKCFQEDGLLEKPNVGIKVAHEDEEEKDEEEGGDENEDKKPNLSFRKIALEYQGVEAGAAVKPALVKKEVKEIQDRLTERQQKILQDFHVKFVLEGVTVEEDDESRARKHSEFVELKKRLEVEEKMYAGCALGEASDIVDIKDQMEPGETGEGDSYIADGGGTGGARNGRPTQNVGDGEETSDSSTSTAAVGAVRATMEGVISGLAEVAICRPGDSSPEEEGMPLQCPPRNARNARKGVVDEDDEWSELQEYTSREGSVACQCCCRKAGKQIDEGNESDVYMTHSSYSVLNVVCPVSGIPVVDLEDPVRSEECEHIYDRLSALNFIASMARDGFCLCASPGCRALLSQNKLVTDSRLWQDIEELRQIKAAMWESRMLQDLLTIDDSDDD